MSAYYWIKQPSGECGCVVGDKQVAAHYGEILGTLPASPILMRDGKDDCPPFCYTPDECLNHGCCRKNRACDD